MLAILPTAVRCLFQRLPTDEKRPLTCRDVTHSTAKRAHPHFFTRVRKISEKRSSASSFRLPLCAFSRNLLLLFFLKLKSADQTKLCLKSDTKINSLREYVLTFMTLSRCFQLKGVPADDMHAALRQIHANYLAGNLDKNKKSSYIVTYCFLLMITSYTHAM